MLICCIRLLCGWSFRLYYHITHIIFLLLCEFFTPAIVDGFLTGVWMITSLLKSPVVYSVVWSIFKMSLSCFTVFFNSQARSRYLCFFSFSLILLCGQPGRQRPKFGNIYFSCRLWLGLVVWPRLGDPFVSENRWNVCRSHSPGQILCYAYTILMVELQFLVQRIVHHLAHPVVSSLIVFLR